MIRVSALLSGAGSVGLKGTGAGVLNLLTVTGPPVGPFSIAWLKQLYPILKLI